MEFSEITQNKGYYAVQGHSVSPTLVLMSRLAQGLLSPPKSEYKIGRIPPPLRLRSRTPWIQLVVRGSAVSFPRESERPLFSQLGDLGSVVSSPFGVRGGAPAENGFWRILNATERSFLHVYDKIWEWQFLSFTGLKLRPLGIGIESPGLALRFLRWLAQVRSQRSHQARRQCCGCG